MIVFSSYYRWSYNGIAVEESQDLRGRYSAADGTLLIDNVTPRDKGIVTCTADNGFGIAPFASASISVQCEFYWFYRIICFV